MKTSRLVPLIGALICCACGSGDAPSATTSTIAADAQGGVSLAWASPAEGSTIHGNATLTLAGSGFVNVEIFEDQVFTTRCTVAADHLTATCNLDTTQLGDGPLTLTAHAWDSPAGTAYHYDADAGALDLVVDNSSVVLAWQSPAQGETVSGTAALTLTGQNFVNVEIFENGAFLSRCAVANASTATCSIDTTQFADGPLTLTAHAWNSAPGTPYTHDADGGALDLTVSNTVSDGAVTLAWASPANGATVSGTMSATLTGAGLVNVEVFHNGAFLSRCAVTQHDQASCSIDTTQLGNGPLTLTAHAWNSPPGTAYTADADAGALTVTVNNGGSSGGSVPSDGSGVHARRIADMMEIFGANIYLSPQDGSSSDTVDGVTAATRYIVGDSGLTMMYRGYADNIDLFSANGPAIFNATGGTFSLCMGIGDQPDPSKVIALAQASVNQGHWIRFIEGGNEPNTNFGAPYQTYVGAGTELAAMQQIYAAVHPLGIAVAAPSVVGDANGIAGYWGNDLGAAVAASDVYNTHLYPNNGGPNGANQMHDWAAAVSAIWGGKPGIMSEWQPVLYNNVANDDTSAAYWTPIALLSGYVDFQLEGLFWWEINDYNGFNPHVGLFADDPSRPYPAAKVMHAMYGLTGDHGSTKHTFTPGMLDVTVSGLPAGPNRYDGGRYALFQNSSGTFFLFIWNEQNQLNVGASQNVHVTFNSGPVASVTDYSLTNPVSAQPTPKQSLSNVSAIDVNLTTEVRLLRITR